MSVSFDLPSVADVRANVTINAEQVNPLYGGKGATVAQAIAAFEADISARIARKATDVEFAIKKAARPFTWPSPDDLINDELIGEDENEAALTTEQEKEIATEATVELVAESLYNTARLYNSAKEHRDHANALIAQIADSVKLKAGSQSEGSVGIGVLTINVGESYPTDEYSTTW